MRAVGVSVVASGVSLLDGVDLELSPGEVVGVVGANGAGKSTLVRVLSGEVSLFLGRVELDGALLDRFTPLELALRRAVVSQHGAVEGELTVLESVLLGRSPHPGRGDDRADLRAARAALEAAGARGFEDRLVPTLSGGERQRVRLARAFAQLDVGAARSAGKVAPSRFLLLDEPLQGLDLAQHVAVARAITAAAHDEGIGVLAVHHDVNLAAATCDRVVVLRAGRVLASGGARDVLTAAVVERAFDVKAHTLSAPWRADATWIAIDPGESSTR